MSELDARMAAWGREQARADGVPEQDVEAYSAAMQKTLLGEATRLRMARDEFLASVARPMRPIVRRLLGPDPLEYAERKRDEHLRGLGLIP